MATDLARGFSQGKNAAKTEANHRVSGNGSPRNGHRS
jgi:hypothetical protein